MTICDSANSNVWLRILGKLQYLIDKGQVFILDEDTDIPRAETGTVQYVHLNSQLKKPMNKIKLMCYDIKFKEMFYSNPHVEPGTGLFSLGSSV